MKIEIDVIRSDYTTFGSLKVGQAFKWVEKRDSGDVHCLKVRYIASSKVGWMPLAGSNVGTIFESYDSDKVRDVS